MAKRVVPLFVAAVALVLYVSAAAPAQDKGGRFETHDGKIVSVKADKLIMSVDGKEHTHMLAPDAKIMLDGKTAVLQDLKPGMRIRVTTPKNDKRTVVRLLALDKNKEFPKATSEPERR
jgi:hypothetical protein